MVRNIGNNWNFDNTDEWLPAPRFGGGLDLSPYGEPLCYSGAWQESLAAAEPAGEPAQRFVYDAYGRLLSINLQDDDATDPDAADASLGSDREIRYHGYVGDPECSPADFRLRSWNSNLGIWLTHEPLGYVDGGNLFDYAGYRPDAEITPLGRCPCCLNPPVGILLERDPAEPGEDKAGRQT